MTLAMRVAMCVAACCAASPAASPAQLVAEGRFGFVGLGTMGYHMAGHLVSAGKKIKVWNRSGARAQSHAKAFSTEAVAEFEGFADCGVVFTCLPTSAEVSAVADSLASVLRPGAILVDCTSGEPSATVAIAARLGEAGIRVVDCPVSGGPAGAEAGTLTTMLGGADDDVAAVLPLVASTFSKKAVHVGPIGSGHAVKAINNALNTAHVLLGAEGLLALRKFGVPADVALSVINSSSGRSLATQERLPEEALTGRFGYGFKLPLMAKDMRIARDLLSEHFPEATLLPEAVALMNAAEDSEWGPDADYSAVVRLLEERAGADLRVDEAAK